MWHWTKMGYQLKNISTENESKRHPTTSKTCIWSQEKYLSRLLWWKLQQLATGWCIICLFWSTELQHFLPLALITAAVARAILTKVPMAVISESNDHSRIAGLSCIAAIVDELKKLMGKLCNRCSLQFRSKFAFALLTHFDWNIALQWNYNKAHHGKGPMESVRGTIKRVSYGLVKSRHININTFCSRSI